MINRIFITGFRATGKSTIARILAKKIDWNFLDIDEEIVKRTNRSINQITKSGSNWSEFRRMESEVLKELLQQEKIVVSTGGGVFVNKLPSQSGSDYGKINTEVVSADEETEIILLTANWETIKERIKRHEQRDSETVRPILNEKTASEAEKYKHNKKLTIEAILNDSRQSYEARKEAYSKITNQKFDCGKYSCTEIAERIIEALKIK